MRVHWLLAVGLGVILALPAVAQGGPAPADKDAKATALKDTVDGLLKAIVLADEAAITKAVREDATVLLRYNETRFLSRKDFIQMLQEEPTSTLEFSDLKLKVADQMGFAEAKMSVPGFVDGFFYAVCTYETGNWQVAYAVSDPMSEMMSAAKRADLTKVIEAFGAEVLDAQKKGTMEPIASRLDPEHIVMVASFGGQVMAFRGHDEVMGIIQQAQGMTMSPQGEPKAGKILGDTVFVLWADVNMTAQGMDLSTCSALVGTIKDGKVLVTGMFMGAVPASPPPATVVH